MYHLISSRPGESHHDLSFAFQDIVDGANLVQFRERLRNGKQTTLSCQVTLADAQMCSWVHVRFPEVVADLLDLATAILTVDRLSVQAQNQPEKRLYILLPVRNPEHMNHSDVKDKLHNLLYWATGKHWDFEFIKRCLKGRMIETQAPLPLFDDVVRPVALWSGGLDALAGLNVQLKQNPGLEYQLLGSGSNDQVFHAQKAIFEQLLRQPLMSRRLNLCQVPIKFSYSSGLKKNKISRARGIVFMLVGAAYAFLNRQSYLEIYENGIGALNLPYRASEIGLDHSRGVHPLTLFYVSRLLSSLFQTSFEVKNPFQFWTKAEMCSYISDPLLVSWTSSCDSKHRKPEARQCGYCTSCVLRRISLMVAEIPDTSNYITNHKKRSELDQEKKKAFLSMAFQARKLREKCFLPNKESNQWENFSGLYPDIDDAIEQIYDTQFKKQLEVKNKTLNLYHKYSREWQENERILEEKIFGSYIA